MNRLGTEGRGGWYREDDDGEEEDGGEGEVDEDCGGWEWGWNDHRDGERFVFQDKAREIVRK